MLHSWCNHTITRIRPGVMESRGSSVPDWNNASSLDIAGCSVQPASTDSVLDGRVNGVAESLIVYVPDNADVLAGDRIVYEGNTYIIDGEPKIWQSPTGRVSHMQLQVERWHG